MPLYCFYAIKSLLNFLCYSYHLYFKTNLVLNICIIRAKDVVIRWVNHLKLDRGVCGKYFLRMSWIIIQTFPSFSLFVLKWSILFLALTWKSKDHCISNLDPTYDNCYICATITSMTNDSPQRGTSQIIFPLLF